MSMGRGGGLNILFRAEIPTKFDQNGQNDHSGPFWSSTLSQGPLNRGVSNGGASRSGLVLPFFVLFGTFPIFPGLSRFARGWPGDFPDSSLSLSRPIKSTYEEQSRKGPWHNLDLSRESGKPPGLETPRFGLSRLSGGTAATPYLLTRWHWERKCVNIMGKLFYLQLGFFGYSWASLLTVP